MEFVDADFTLLAVYRQSVSKVSTKKNTNKFERHTKMATLLLMWVYDATPVATMQFQSMAACMKASVRFENTYGEALLVNRCLDSKTGETK